MATSRNIVIGLVLAICLGTVLVFNRWVGQEIERTTNQHTYNIHGPAVEPPGLNQVNHASAQVLSNPNETAAHDNSIVPFGDQSSLKQEAAPPVYDLTVADPVLLH